MNRLGWSIRPWGCGERDSVPGDGALDLLEPADWMRGEYLAYTAEFHAMGAPFHAQARQEAIRDFPALLQRIHDWSADRNLPPGYMPQSEYWLFRGDRLVGTCRLRHRLSEELERTGGHIGYDVRPTERGRGYARRMLGMMLGKARQLGLDRALLTCAKDNAASARVIQKHGGQLDAEYTCEIDGQNVLMQRYWIDL